MTLDLKKLEKDIKKLKEGKKKKSETNVLKGLKKKISGKRVLKKSQATIVVKDRQPAEYVPIYFQTEINQVKKDMGFFK